MKWFKTLPPRYRYPALALLLAVLALAAWLLWPRDRTLQEVQDRGVLRVAMDPSFPPLENLDPATKRPVGLDVDLANALAARLGVRAEIVTVGFDELVDAVAARRVDAAISGLNYDPWRTRDVAFSASYVEAGIVLVAAPGTPITGTAGLAGRRVAVEWGSQGDEQVRALSKTLSPAATRLPFESAGQALAAVAGGRADAAAVDAISLALFDGAEAGERLQMVGPPLHSNPYVVVVDRRAPALLRAINDALAALEADGTLPKIRNRWLDK